MMVTRAVIASEVFLFRRAAQFLDAVVLMQACKVARQIAIRRLVAFVAMSNPRASE
jgi:hypothetical protein